MTVSGSGLPPSPSAIVSPGTISTSRPARTLTWNAFDAATSMPTISQAGATAVAATATPLISPPPPIGTTSVSISGTSSNISVATVAAPAITSSSLYGEMNVPPSFDANSFACFSASS